MVRMRVFFWLALALLSASEACYDVGKEDPNAGPVEIGKETSVCLKVNGKQLSFKPIADEYSVLDIPGCTCRQKAPQNIMAHDSALLARASTQRGSRRATQIPS